MLRLPSNPAQNAAAVTPNDTTDLAVEGRYPVGLYIGGAGTLRVTTYAGDVVDFAAVSAGVLPLQVQIVHSTGTSATSIVALYN